MSKIMLLCETTACRIAAGEVVDRPVAVVKELIENAIDAGATSISIAIGGGGIDYITVIDDGSGISQEDIPLAFQRHATSKILDHSDLDRITSLGFRGEALPSIASVSKITLKSKVMDNIEGYQIDLQGGQRMHFGPVGCPVGTNITVRDLFFNTPARRKYLKSKATESGLINDLVSKMALINPKIRFTLEHNDRQVISTTGSGKIMDVLVFLYGQRTAELMLATEGEAGSIGLSGYVGKPELSRSTRQQITLAVNGRLVRSQILNSVIGEAYHGLLTVGRFPVVVLLFTVPPEMVDVNIHPAKMEIKIDELEHLVVFVKKTIRQVLQQSNLIPSIKPDHQPQNKITASMEPFQLELHQTTVHTTATDANPLEATRPSGVFAVAEETGHHLPNESVEFSKSMDSVAETCGAYQQIATPFPALRYVGQVLASYIVAEDDNAVYFIDQHAAHERIMFEKFYALLKGAKPETQYLLTPINVSLQSRENKYLLKHLEKFRNLGFVMESFGFNSWLLRGIPADYTPAESEQLFIDIAESLMENSLGSNDRIDFKVAALMACKSSVKGGQYVSPQGIKTLLNRLSQCQEPYTCPHGRPTVVSIVKHELDHMFKRV